MRAKTTDERLVQYVGETTSKLVKNKWYRAKPDKSTKYLRVKDESGKWSKYSPENFKLMTPSFTEVAEAVVTKAAAEDAEKRTKTYVKERTEEPAEETTEPKTEKDTLSVEEIFVTPIRPIRPIRTLKESPHTIRSESVYRAKRTLDGKWVVMVRPDIHMRIEHTLVKPITDVDYPRLYSVLDSMLRANSKEEFKRIADKTFYAICEAPKCLKRALPVAGYPVEHVREDAYDYDWVCPDCAFKVEAETKEIKTKEESTMTVTRKEPKKVTLREYLEAQGVPSSLIEDVIAFRKEYPVEGEEYKDVMHRIVRPHTLYQGPAWTAAIAAILEGHNLLLEGPKATGKNVLCQSLAYLFGRPTWDVSFHVNTDASSLIGDDTFRRNEVQFRPGPIYEAAKYGGFAILDEINMAKSEAVAVLHAVLDDRRVIDIPGYERMKLHEATRFIGTMNYGYTGTRELNEALVSRFVVISIPPMTEEELKRFLRARFQQLSDGALDAVVKVFKAINDKATSGEISSRAVDLRGIISGIQLVRRGIAPLDAMRMSVVNKVFDEYERKIVGDVVALHVSESWEPNYFFPTKTTVTVDFGGVK